MSARRPSGSGSSRSNGAAGLAHQAAGAAADGEGDVRRVWRCGGRRRIHGRPLQRRTGTRRGGPSSSAAARRTELECLGTAPRRACGHDRLPWSPALSRTARASGLTAAFGEEKPLEGLDRIGRAGRAGQQQNTPGACCASEPIPAARHALYQQPRPGRPDRARTPEPGEIGVGGEGLNWPSGTPALAAAPHVPAPDRPPFRIFSSAALSRVAGERTAMSPSAGVPPRARHSAGPAAASVARRSGPASRPNRRPAPSRSGAAASM